MRSLDEIQPFGKYGKAEDKKVSVLSFQFFETWN
jgi:hypothetical protein